MIGQNLSHYEVLQELGRGGMGVVYKARDTSLGRLVALKLLPPELAGDPRRVALLRREAQAVARLNHPRIVTIYAVEEAAGHLFLTMEYVEGRTLDKAIPAGGFPLDRFLRIAIPLADALAAAHEQKIIHRDLKPGNIILSLEDRPKILDFGLARLRLEESAEFVLEDGKLTASRAVTQLETLEGGLAGTVPYMSPEQLSRRRVDQRTDIFSLGVVFYEMATGRHPYRSSDGLVGPSILAEEPQSVADVRTELPRQLGRIIRRCLEKNPNERLQSAKDLRHQLQDVEQEVASSKSQAAPPPPQRPRRPRRLRAALLLSAVLLAVVGWLLYAPLDDPPTDPRPPLLAVEEARIFSGDRGPDYRRRGAVDLLQRTLSGIEGVWVLGEEGPKPDLVIRADARTSEGLAALGFRLQDPLRKTDLGDGVLEGDSGDLFELVTRAGRSIAQTLGHQLGRDIVYRPARPPTTDATALDLYFQAAAAARPGGQPADAVMVRDLLGRALERDPKFALAHALTGRSYLEEQRSGPAPGLATAAEKSCRTAAELDPRLGEASTCLGEALMMQDRLLDAVAAFEQALRFDTSHLKPHVGLRNAFLDLGLPEQAEQTWRRLIDEHPTYWAGYYSLGTYYQDVERYEDALRLYRQALELAPMEPDVYSYLGTTYFYLGRFEEATVALQRSIEIRPTWDAYYNLGGVYFDLRRFEAAVTAFEEATRLDESDYRSRGRLGWACYWAPGRRAEAPRHLRRALALTRPDDPDALILTALFRALLGERVASLAALDAAIELRPNNSHYFFLAGLATNHLGDTEAALDWLGRAVAGGWSTAEIRTIIDLENLHGDARFQQLLRGADAGQP